jgi:hypothetical protein
MKPGEFPSLADKKEALPDLRDPELVRGVDLLINIIPGTPQILFD